MKRGMEHSVEGDQITLHRAIAKKGTLTNTPYSPMSQFLKKRFGERVQTIPVSIASDCPNRRGLRGMQTCIFCDEWGSAAYPEQAQLPITQQINLKQKQLGTRYRSRKFLVYFQAYTNTFLAVKKLREHFEAALSVPDVVGLVVGTRPDCLSADVLSLWREFHERTFLSVELGIQSFQDSQLQFLRRGHRVKDSFEAVKKIKECTNIPLGIHLMFGLPGENSSHIREAAEFSNRLNIDWVKLHNLHVLRNTPLETLYRAGGFQPVELDAYAQQVILFLQHLKPHIYIQRLAALCSHWEELVAPSWTRHKMRSHQYIIDRLNQRGAYQGQFAN